MKTLAISAIAIVATGLALTPAAHAATEFGFQYSYDAETIQTEAGARVILEDLKQEIESHCESHTTGSRLTRFIVDRRCTAVTLEKTVTQINAPMLTKVYEESMIES